MTEWKPRHLSFPQAMYCARHDAFYHEDKDEWCEKQCTDPDCEFCVNRPERPSMVLPQPPEGEK